MTLEDYIDQTSEPIKTLCYKYLDEYKRRTNHLGKQREVNGLRVHTIQVIEKALELN